MVFKKHSERSEEALRVCTHSRLCTNCGPQKTTLQVGIPRSARNVNFRPHLAIALLASLFLLTSCRSSGITVQIVNQTPAAIRSIEVIYPGGSYGIANLARGNSHAKWIKPSADAALRINYLDAAGQKHQLETATIKQGYAGGLAIVLLPQDQVKVEDNTHAE
jgi:hypothetical protein